MESKNIMSRNELGAVNITRHIATVRAEYDGKYFMFGLQANKLPDGRFRATLYDLKQSYGKDDGYACFIPLSISKDGKTAAPMAIKEALSACRLGAIIQKVASFLETGIEHISWRARAGQMMFRLTVEPAQGGMHNIATEIISAKYGQSAEFPIELIEPLSWLDFNKQLKTMQSWAKEAALRGQRSSL